MAYDEDSFLQGIVAGKAMKGMSTAKVAGGAVVATPFVFGSATQEPIAGTLLELVFGTVSIIEDADTFEEV